MKTYTPSINDIKREWYVVDLEGKNLGRAASKVAKILMGKHKPTYSPHMDNGDFVIILNADKFSVTGNKMNDKVYRHHSGHPGGLKEVTLRELLKKHPKKPFTLAVKNMLPKNKLRAKRMKRLKVYCEGSHPHEAQQPRKLEV